MPSYKWSHRVSIEPTHRFRAKIRNRTVHFVAGAIWNNGRPTGWVYQWRIGAAPWRAWWPLDTEHVPPGANRATIRDGVLRDYRERYGSSLGATRRITGVLREG
jgi:hypothetical protein